MRQLQEKFIVPLEATNFAESSSLTNAYELSVRLALWMMLEHGSRSIVLTTTLRGIPSIYCHRSGLSRMFADFLRVPPGAPVIFYGAVRRGGVGGGILASGRLFGSLAVHQCAGSFHKALLGGGLVPSGYLLFRVGESQALELKFDLDDGLHGSRTNLGFPPPELSSAWSSHL